MKNELKEKILELQNMLRNRENKSSSFFEKLINDIDNGFIDEVINSILKSYSITQYADFSTKEEELFDKIWNIAHKINDEK